MFASDSVVDRVRCGCVRTLRHYYYHYNLQARSTDHRITHDSVWKSLSIIRVNNVERLLLKQVFHTKEKKSILLTLDHSNVRFYTILKCYIKHVEWLCYTFFSEN